MWMNAFVGSYSTSIINKTVKIVVAITFLPAWLRLLRFVMWWNKIAALLFCGGYFGT